jgi:hypothetical protein
MLPCSLLNECAEAVSGLSSALERVRLAVEGDSAASTARLVQVGAALLTAKGSLEVATQLALPRNDAFRLARGSFQLAFGVGKTVLAAEVAASGPAELEIEGTMGSTELLLLLISVVLSIGWLVPDRRREGPSELSTDYNAALFVALAPFEARLAWLADVADAALACYPPGGKPGGCWLRCCAAFL